MKGTFALLAAAQAADLLTTWYGLNHGAHEGNPAALAMVGFGGWAMVAFLKFGTVPAAAGLTWLAPTDKGRAFMLAAVRFGAAMVFGVAAGNVLVTL